MVLLWSSSRCQLDKMACYSSKGHTPYSFHTLVYVLPCFRNILHASVFLSINPLRSPLWSIRNSVWSSYSFSRTLHLLLISHYNVTTGLFICIYIQRDYKLFEDRSHVLFIFDFPVAYITLGTCQDQMLFRI